MRTQSKSSTLAQFQAVIGTWGFLLGLSLPLAGHAQVPQANLTLWADASSITGLNDGDPVAVWSNKSPNVSLNLTQGTANMRPTYQTNEVNGLPTVRFDGINDVLAGGAMTNFIGSATSAYTMFSVFNANVINTDSATPYMNDTVIGDQSGFAGQHLKGLSALAYNWDGNADRIGTPINTDTWYVLRSRLDTDSLYVQANMQLEQSTNSGPNTLVAGHPLNIGGRTSSTVWLDGDISEVLIYNRALTLTERQFVTSYLGDKYGIVVPEPTSLALWATGFLLLLARRGARRSA